MWWRLLLLCIYAGVLFVLARILETVAFYEHGYLASRLLDPLSLSVQRLKLLLDQRGIGYHGVVEKKELSELLENTGDVTDGELDCASKAEDDSLQVSHNFTSGSHFYEEVEDTKDSIWLVHVIKDRHSSVLNELDWRTLVKKLVRFGVRTGIFDCSTDWRLCLKKGWYKSQVVLAYPQGFHAKDSVILGSFKGVPSVASIFDWVNLNVASRIKNMYDFKEIEKERRQYERIRDKSTKWVSVYYFSKLRKIPMFLSFLSIKFTGRVKFRQVNVHTKEGKNVLKKLGFERTPLYFVMTPERNFTYGKGYGQYFSFSSLDMFLRTLSPEVNDVFKLSLLLLNFGCFFEFFIRQGGPIRRMMKLLWALVKYNCALLMLWLPVLGFMKLPSSEYVMFYLLKFLRLFSGSSVAGMVRQDILLGTYNSDIILATFLTIGIIVGIREYKRTGGVEEDMGSPDWWSMTWDGYTSYLFQPMASLSRPMTPQDLDLEEGMELLIERLAVPNLWLQPIIQIDYMKNLPVWPYRGPTLDSPFSSDSEASDSGQEPSDPPSDGKQSTPSITKPTLESIGPGLNSSAAGVSGSTSTAPTAIRPLTPSIPNLSEMSHHDCAKLVMDANYQCTCATTQPSNAKTGPSRVQELDVEANNVNKINKKCQERKEELENEQPAFPSGMIACTECVICLDAYKNGVLICGLPCGHTFHQQCILEWLARDKHCCPVCRWPTYKSKRSLNHRHDE